MTDIRLYKAFKLLREEVQALSAIEPAQGLPGKDGQPGHDGAAGKDGRDGKDGLPGRDASVSDVAAVVLAQIEPPADGKDGRDGKDGVSPSAGAVARQVRLLVKNGKQGEPGRAGQRGPQGKPGASITDVKLTNNELFVYIDGKRRKAGTVKVPRPAVPFVGGGGGGGHSVTPDKVGFIAYSDDTVTVSTDPDAPSHMGLLVEGDAQGIVLVDGPTGTIENVSGRVVTAIGTISFKPVKGTGGAVTASVFSESSTDGGTTWTVNTGSLRPVEVSKTGESFKTAVSFALNFQPGTQARFRILSSGESTLTLEPSSARVLGGQTVTGHSIVFALSEMA